MGTMPRLVSVLLLGVGVAVVGCNTTGSNVKDNKSAYKNNPTFGAGKDATAKQVDNSQFQTKNPTATVGQPTAVTSNFVTEQAPVGMRSPAPATLTTDNHSFNPPPSTAAMNSPPSVVLPPRPTGDAQLTTQQPADTSLHVGYGPQAMHAPDADHTPPPVDTMRSGPVRTVPSGMQDADRIPTVEVAPSSSQGTPLPPIITTSGSTTLPSAPVPVPPPATTSNFNSPTPSFSAGSNGNPPLPPLPPPLPGGK